MKYCYVLIPLGIGALLAGCGKKPEIQAVPEAKVAGDTVTMVTNSPQLAALTVEPVGDQRPSVLPLAGRLIWNEDATSRVFTPFAGIVRKLLVDLNQPVKTGEPLA